MKQKRNAGLFFCGLLIVAAIFFPAEVVAERLAIGQSARIPDLITGTLLLRLSFVGIALALLIMLLIPITISGQGMPATVTGQVNDTQSGSHWGFVFLLGILGTLLRIFQLGNDLWLDEISTLVNFGHWPITDTLTQFVSANQHVLYVFLANISISLLGGSEATVRIPAVIFGVASIFALYYLARFLTNEREALWATALLTVAYHHVWFSQNARGWSGLLFFSVLGTGLFLRGLTHNRNRTWFIYCLVMALGILMHLNTLFVFLGHLTAYLLVLPRWSDWRQRHWPLTRRLIWVGFLSGTLTVLFHSFILPKIVNYYLTVEFPSDAIGWKNPLDLLAQIGLGLNVGFLGVGALLVGYILLIGLASFWKQSRVLVGLLVLPVGFNVLAYVAMQIGAYPRHFIYMLPLGLIIAVRGAFTTAHLLANIMSRWGSNSEIIGKFGRFTEQYGAPSVLVILLIGSLASLIPYYQTPKQDYRGALAYVDQKREPQELVAAVGLAASSYRSLYGPDLLFPETAEALAALEDGAPGIWVIFTFSRDMRIRYGELFDYLEENYEDQAVFPGTVGDGTIYVMKKKGK